MKFALPIALFCAAILAISTPAQAAVEVAFIEPENYTDGSVRGGLFTSGGFGTANVIRAHLMTLGDKTLSPREGLRIEILDIDLAGQYEWWKFPFDARVMRTSSMPAIEVRYIYYVNGKRVEEGEERITDMNYLQRARAAGANERLYYEKKMLDRWFRARFANREAAKADQ